MKDGEDSKRKFYRALIQLGHPLSAEQIIQRINGRAPLEIQQKTPIRVLHRYALFFSSSSTSSDLSVARS